MTLSAALVTITVLHCLGTITRSCGGAFGLITDRLLSQAKDKAPQLGRFQLTGVLAIASDHVFASILLDRRAAEYLMTSVPQFNVPLDGRPTYTTTDLKHAIFYRVPRQNFIRRQNGPRS
jgi:hypothetical protein